MEMDLNPVLRRMLETGRLEQPDGTSRQIHSAISSEEGRFLYKIVTDQKPARTLEVGLAFGVSAHFICDALRQHGGAVHTIIEPWPWAKGAAVKALESAGHAQRIKVLQLPSYSALPQMLEAGERFDFVFIDGRHRFTTHCWIFFTSTEC